ncbi:PREDICTED: uncharacterized protein LOC109464165 [Branchiostoma belcheri]|uniref:Uncharacterized protein LOC109464165 n=1 Tax=Branchiostoma belcheri TaxID=7741 RepID=A0A6P4YI20_BRABE|nr:PREDICTED: uncharacterized protein LOC109464165 [Branchiostoma belcheri]
MTNGPVYTASVTSTTSSLVPDDFGDTEEVKDDSADTMTIAIVVVILILIIATGTGIGAFMCKTKRKYSVNAAVDKDDDEQKNPKSQPAKRDQEFQLSLFSEKTLTETRAPNNAHFS